MSKDNENLRNKRLCRVFIASVSLLAMLAAGGIMVGVIERVLEAVDRAH